MLKRFVSTGILLAAGVAVGQEDYSEWSFMKEVTVNTTSAGIDIAEDVADYPLLVRLDSDDAAIFAQAGGNGASLRFTKEDGTTRLPHSVDHWDAVGQSAAIWVLVDTVYGDDAEGVHARMYWGKVGAADSSSASAVFDTANGFRAVWHLGESASPSVDVTEFATEATWESEPTSVPGLIGNAVELSNPSGDVGRYLNADYNVTNNNFKTNSTDGLTYSVWVNRNSNNGQNEQGVIGRYRWSVGGRQVILAARSSGNWRMFRSIDGSGNETDFGDVPAAIGEWTHLVGTVRNGEQVLYVNGVADVTQNTAEVGSLDSVWSNVPLRIGVMDPSCGCQYFDGIVDEARLADTTRSADWIKLDYASQVPGGTAVSLSATDTLNPFVIISELRYEVGNADAIDSLSFPAFNTVDVTPSYVGQTPDSFSVSGSLPADVDFNSETGTLTGTPSTTFDAELTFTAHVDAETATRAVRLVVVPGIANLRYVPDNTANRDTLYMETGDEVNLVPEYDGGPADSIKLTGQNTSVPAGITVNPETGAITGTPTAVFTGNRTVTAYLGNQTTVRPIRFVVALGPLTSLAYNAGSIDVNAGESIDGLVPMWAGRSPTEFSVSPALPEGLALNPRTGVISGTPTEAAAEASYTVTATNSTDEATATVTIEVDASAADGEYATDWSGHATVTLNTRVSGANVSGTVTDFPVLIRLGAADSAVFSEADGNGDDIRFTKMDNTTRLPHQIDHWDEDALSAAVWVLVDSVRGSDSTQGIRMHWGNAEADGMSNGNAVFDTANGFVSVWHLGGGDEADIRPNAVAGAYPAIPEFFPEDYEDLAGVIGRADTLTGGARDVGSHLALGTGYDDWGGAMSMSMWIKPDGPDLEEWSQYISLSNGQGQDNIWMGRQGGSNNFTTEIWSGSQGGGHTHAEDVQVQNEWQLLSWTVNSGTEVAMYRNGSQLITRTSDQPLKDTLRTVNHIGRAGWPDPSIRAVVDEVRFSNVARSPNWIRLEFENQKPAQSLVSITNDADSSTAIAGLGTTGTPLSFRTLPEGVLFQIRSTVPSKARIEVIDMQGRSVWSRSLASGSGLREVTWNGAVRNGSGIGTGIYFVRMLMLDEGNKPTHRLERKLPITR